MNFERINFPQVILVVAVLGIMGAFVLYGPEDHRATVTVALVGSLTTILAAAQGRLVRRTPEQFEESQQ